MSLLVNDIAQFIRKTDGANQLTPVALGQLISNHLDQAGVEHDGATLGEFVERTNPDKRMGASHLAELICAEFNLPEEGAER